MMQERALRLCLVGLPSTGKTTFIAALWAYLSSGLDSGGFRVTDYPDDPRYLNEIARAWASGDSMPRSSLGAGDRIEFVVETPRDAKITVVLPDLPGEVFRNAIARPMIDTDTAEAVVGSDLLLFFVNGEAAKTFAALGDYAPTKPTQTEDVPVVAQMAPQEFHIEDLDSDTLNTELLHRLCYLIRDRQPLPILVVVSAWDIHDESDSSPSDWLEREQPMFAQVIAEYGLSAATGVVGVSAQGANYKDNPGVVAKGTAERSWTRNATGQKVHIAGPLVWYDEL